MADAEKELTAGHTAFALPRERLALLLWAANGEALTRCATRPLSEHAKGWAALLPQDQSFWLDNAERILRHSTLFDAEGVLNLDRDICGSMVEDVARALGWRTGPSYERKWRDYLDGIEVLRQERQVPRSEPHDAECASVMLVSHTGNHVWLAKRVGPGLAGMWENPCGKLEPGETPIQAALRELEEEADVLRDATQLLHLGSPYLYDGTRRMLVHLFATRLEDGEVPQDTEPHCRGNWVRFTWADARAELTTPSTQALLGALWRAELREVLP